jgi:hypothetical protein
LAPASDPIRRGDDHANNIAQKTRTRLIGLSSGNSRLRGIGLDLQQPHIDDNSSDTASGKFIRSKRAFHMERAQLANGLSGATNTCSTKTT